MAVKTEKIQIETKGNTDILDITEKIAEKVRNSGFTNGIATVINPGSIDFDNRPRSREIVVQIVGE